METQQPPQNHFASLLGTEQGVLGTTQSSIMKLFYTDEKCLIEYSYGKINEIVIEIQFNNAVLTCLFNKLEVCIQSILYIDNLNDVAPYIRYCDSAFEYNNQHETWTSGNCRINLQHPDIVTIFV